MSLSFSGTFIHDPHPHLLVLRARGRHGAGVWAVWREGAVTISQRHAIIREVVQCMESGEPLPCGRIIAHRAWCNKHTAIRHIAALIREGTVTMRGGHVWEVRLPAGVGI